MTIANDRDSAQSSLPASPAAAMLSSALPARPNTRSPITSQRSLKQLGVFFMGAGFMSLATLITRRSILRKRISTWPRFYQQSNTQPAKIESDSSFIAFEALNLATLNVIGFGIMATGGLAWAFDICDVHELRSLARKTLETEGQARTDEAAEQEIEQYFARVLLRKEQTTQDSQANSSSSTDK
jgi:hypothetical protein